MYLYKQFFFFEDKAINNYTVRKHVTRKFFVYECSARPEKIK